MRIAYFHTGTILTSWSLFSLAITLRSLGHEVLDGTIPTDAQGTVSHQLGRAEYQRILATLPSLQDLQSCDLVLVAGPEYIAVWLNTLYGKQPWRNLGARKAGFYLESSKREDVQFRYDALGDWYDVHFFPDPEDVQRFGGHHFTWYVDAEMFTPCPHQDVPGHVYGDGCDLRRMQDKKYSAAFVGSLYPKRLVFLTKLLPLIPEIDFQANSVMVRDLGGERHRLAAELLANNLRQIKVHVALPSNNSMMMVPRPFETMACGTFLLTYSTKDNPFRDGEHCRVYDPAKPEELADMIRYYLAHDDERERIARAGCEEVRRRYSLKPRMAEILEVVTRR
jgi:glycosyltransferase involved in cell wall biosynthesis